MCFSQRRRFKSEYQENEERPLVNRRWQINQNTFLFIILQTHIRIYIFICLSKYPKRPWRICVWIILLLSNPNTFQDPGTFKHIHIWFVCSCYVKSSCSRIKVYGTDLVIHTLTCVWTSSNTYILFSRIFSFSILLQYKKSKYKGGNNIYFRQKLGFNLCIYISIQQECH